MIYNITDDPYKDVSVYDLVTITCDDDNNDNKKNEITDMKNNNKII